jgi:hypothetical protein
MRLPPSVKNWTSLIGATIALISLFMIAFLLVVTVILREQAAYVGLVTYILLPAILVTGLLFIPIGMWRKIRKEHREHIEPQPGWPRIDLNNPTHRNAFFIFAVGTAAFLFFSAIGSYEAFHFTESVRFCGTLCHTVMKPEYTTHENSSHARVACVACHVGPGADWYVRSKISGLYQVYAVLADVYPRPIPTPIKNLRPARAVCEQCHWPKKFYPYQIRNETHYLPDKDNTRWDIRLVMKIGAQEPALGYRSGIHWHINPGVKIEYIAADRGHQKIPWVKYTNLETGSVKFFQDPDSPMSEKEIDSSAIQTMDCIDCHNRPSHEYLAPSYFVNTAITKGLIPKELPEIKSVVVGLCGKEYASLDEAKKQIRKGITNYYEKNYPDIEKNTPQLVEKAINGLQEKFAGNIFPYMKARWSAYPDNIGHLEFIGCFRCHNGTHATATGEVISRECNLCHQIEYQGTPGINPEFAPLGGTLEFRHPVDIDQAWKEMSCTDCHTGLAP